MTFPKRTTARISSARTGKSKTPTELLWGNLKVVTTWNRRRRRGYNIKMELKEIEWEQVNGINLD
jgi:hypothetical protein